MEGPNLKLIINNASINKIVKSVYWMSGYSNLHEIDVPAQCSDDFLVVSQYAINIFTVIAL